MPAVLDIRLRVPTPGLLGLPWADRLADWDATEVPLRDIAVGPSRHLAMAHREAPIASAARMAVVETPTGQLPAVAPVEGPPDSSPAPSAWDL